MVITLYKTASEKIKLEKVLENEVELIGALRDASSVMSPSVLVQEDVIGYNYAYIEEFGRYYYINNITAMRNKAFVLDMKCDVLMSYKDEIREMSGVVSRLTSGSPYAERNVVTSVKEKHKRVDFPECPFTRNGTYVLIAKGGY